MRARGIGYPIDLYLEGSDQHRAGSSFRCCPHWVSLAWPRQSHLDPWLHGRQRRSQDEQVGGNALDVDELLQQYGADVCRWWVASLPFENDIKVDLSSSMWRGSPTARSATPFGS